MKLNKTLNKITTIDGWLKFSNKCYDKYFERWTNANYDALTIQLCCTKVIIGYYLNKYSSPYLQLSSEYVKRDFTSHELKALKILRYAYMAGWTS